MSSAEMKVMLVDDESACRWQLREALAEHDFVRVVAEAASVSDAVRLAAERGPDLVLLDVNLPVRCGFELLPHLAPETDVIFVTAFDTHAVRAFEFNVIDYLLKPIQRARLALALNRVRRARRTGAARVEVEPPVSREEVLLQADGEVRVVPVGDITYIKAVGNYTQVNLAAGRRVLVRRSMESWQEQLSCEQFCRPHRSLIVNLRLMKSVVRRSRDVAELEFRGGVAPVAVGRRASLLLQRSLRQFAV